MQIDARDDVCWDRKTLVNQVYALEYHRISKLKFVGALDNGLMIFLCLRLHSGIVIPFLGCLGR